MSHSILRLWAAVAPIVLLAACDDGGGSGGAGGGSGGAGGGNGGATTTSASNGGGGSGGTATTGDTTGGGGTGGGVTTGTAGSGGGATGACTNAADSAIISEPANDIQGAVTKCGNDNFGAEPGTLDCIKMTGLSNDCSQCFDDTIHCVIDNCIGDCFPDSESQACKDCRAEKCDPAFATCSGLTP